MENKIIKIFGFNEKFNKEIADIVISVLGENHDSLNGNNSIGSDELVFSLGPCTTSMEIFRMISKMERLILKEVSQDLKFNILIEVR